MARPEAETHQAGQALIAAELVDAVRTNAWPLFDPQNIKGTMPRLLAMIMALVHKYGSASAVHAAQFYKAERVAAGIPGRIAVPVAPLPSTSQVQAELQWAVENLYKTSTTASPLLTAPDRPSVSPAAPRQATPGPSLHKAPSGPAGAGPTAPTPVLREAPSAPAPTYDLKPYVIQPGAVEAAQTNVEGLTQTLALDMGRDTIIEAVKQDKKARGWARVPEPGACSFCLMLATRGAVYKSAETAGPNKRGARNKNAGVAFKGDGQFKVHDHCACHVEPLFSGEYEPSPTVQKANDLWKSTPYGSNAKEALNNFRVALQKERDAGRF